MNRAMIIEHLEEVRGREAQSNKRIGEQIALIEQRQAVGISTEDALKLLRIMEQTRQDLLARRKSLEEALASSGVKRWLRTK